MPYIGQQPTQSAFVVDPFNGDGTTTAFTMSVAPANTASVLIAISGVLQSPSTYSVSGTTLTFSAAPPSGTANISARYLGIPASGVTTTAYRTVTTFTATAGQTTFTPPSYTAGFINVYRSGVLLTPTSDYTATNGTTVVLASGATAGDTVIVESFLVSSVLNAIPNTAGAISLSGGVVTGVLPYASLPTGSVLQVVQGTYSTLASSTSTSAATSGLTASITPKFATSKILVMASMQGIGKGNNNPSFGTALWLYRNGSSIVQYTPYTVYTNLSGNLVSSNSYSYVDSPATTSSTSYAIYFATTSAGNLVYLQNNGDVSTIILMEIAG